MVFSFVVFSAFAKAQTCGISATDVSFGSVNPGSSSTLKDTSVTNSGDTSASLTISGQDWTDGAGHNMTFSQTFWNTTSAPVALTNSFVSVDTIAPSIPFVIHLSVQIPARQFAATYNQIITLEATC